MAMGKILSNGRLLGRNRVRAMVAIIMLAGVAACSSPEERIVKYHASGQEFLEEGDYGRANVQFQNALKIDEAHVPSLVGLAKIAEDKQDFKGMFALLQRIVRLDPENIDALVNLGRLYLIGSDETAALENADKAMALNAENAATLALKGAIQLKIGDHAGAVAFAEKAIAINPVLSEAVTILATERVLADESEEAIAEIDRALAIDEKISILQLLRIQILSNMGRQDDVRDALYNLIELFPEEVAYRRVYVRELMRRDEFAEAEEQLVEVAKIDSDNIEAKLDVVRIINRMRGVEVALSALKTYVDAEPDNADLSFAYGDFMFNQKKLDDARAVYTRLAGSDDQDVVLKAQNQLASVFLLEGDREDASALIEEILSEDEGNPAALVKRAGLRIDAKKYDDAILDLRTALNNDPDIAAASLLMAAAFERKGDLALAQSQLAAAVEASNQHAKTANVFAKFLMRQRNTERAEEVLVDSLAVNPGDLVNLKFLAAIRLANQDWHGATEVAGIIESIDKENASVTSIKGIAYSGLENYDGVINALTIAKERAPLESRPLATLIAAYLKSGRAEEAETLLRDMIETKDEHYVEKILLVQVMSAVKRYDEAEEILLTAVDERPDRQEAFEIIYRYYARNGRRDEAAVIINEGLAKAPQNAALRVLKADILLNEGRLAEAFTLFEALVDERPNDKIIVNNYVSLASDLRKDQERVIIRALEVSKVLDGEDNPYYLDTRGWVHYRAGAYEKALELLKEAVAGEDKNPEILYHLGAAYLANNDTENARTYLERALELGGGNFPNAGAARELLERV